MPSSGNKISKFSSSPNERRILTKSNVETGFPCSILTIVPMLTPDFSASSLWVISIRIRYSRILFPIFCRMAGSLISVHILFLFVCKDNIISNILQIKQQKSF